MDWFVPDDLGLVLLTGKVSSCSCVRERDADPCGSRELSLESDPEEALVLLVMDFLLELLPWI